jgi:hypothetical protein
MGSCRTDEAARDDVRHLGTLVGGSANRIVALSSSAVFLDRSLTLTYWGTDEHAIDSGFQGHLYTRPDDVLVIRLPDGDERAVARALTAIEANRDVWARLTSIGLSSRRDPVVAASDHPRPKHAPQSVAWHVGGLLEAAVDRHRRNGEALLAFVLDRRLSRALGLRGALGERARVTSLLMDKNVAMRLLQDKGVECARTLTFDRGTDYDVELARLRSSGRYVFKPAGGAAGIGVFDDGGRGATVDRLRDHIRAQEGEGRLPLSFQVQEFLPGSPFGITAHFAGDGRFAVLDVHRQQIDSARRFAGGRWSRALQDKLLGQATALCSQVAAIEEPRLTGLICLDVIQGKVIEINPRVTASAPIPHLLARNGMIARHVGGGFRIERIDLRTRVRVPYELIESGAFARLVERTMDERRVLVLPQGLNPFGESRLAFVNDDEETSVQRHILERLELISSEGRELVRELS